MRIPLTLIALACLSLQAQEIRTTGGDRVALGATFYQNGLAVVRDTRRVVLPAGRSRLAFADLLPTLRPKSATLLDPGAGVAVLERNFEFDLLSPASLTRGSLGLPAWPRAGASWDTTGLLASLPLLHPRLRADAANPGFSPLPSTEGGPRSDLEFLHQEWLARRHPPVRRLGIIQNRKEANLGRALPEGILELRYRDPGGLVLPLTEALGAAASWPQTPPLEAVELALGEARGFQVDRRPTEKRLVKGHWVYTLEVRIASRLGTASHVVVREPLMAGGQLLEASHRGSRSGANAYDFQVPVPALGSATLRYTVRTAKPE